MEAQLKEQEEQKEQPKDWQKNQNRVLNDARKMVLEALDIRFTNVSIDIYAQIKALSDKILLKKDK